MVGDSIAIKVSMMLLFRGASFNFHPWEEFGVKKEKTSGRFLPNRWRHAGEYNKVLLSIQLKVILGKLCQFNGCQEFVFSSAVGRDAKTA